MRYAQQLYKLEARTLKERKKNAERTEGERNPDAP